MTTAKSDLMKTDNSTIAQERDSLAADKPIPATTGIYSMSMPDFLATLFAMRLASSARLKIAVIAVIIITLANIIIGFIFDLRYIIIALMILLLMMPLAAAMLYICDALKPLIFFNPLPHSIAFVDDTLILKIYSKKDLDDDSIPAITIPFSQITSYKIRNSDVIFSITRDRQTGWLYLPVDAFESPESFARAFDIINS